MLQLDGNSEQAFAQLNAINMNPVVWAEWNYNNLTKPYVVTSDSTGNITSISNLLNVGTNWNSVYVSSTGVDKVGAGPYFETTGQLDAIELSTGITNEFEKFTCNLPYSGSGWYKVVYYIKANMPNNVGSSQIISASSITVTASGTATVASSDLHYKVIPVSSNGIRPLFDPNGVDIKRVAQNTNRYLDIKWQIPSSAISKSLSKPIAYDIYRGIGAVDPLPWIATIPAKNIYKSDSTHYHYVDDLTVVSTQTTPNTFESMTHKVSSAVRLSSGGVTYALSNFIEDTRCFTRYFSEDTGTLMSKDESIEIDGVKYYRVETYFGVNKNFDWMSFELNFHGTTMQSSVLVSGFEVYKIDEWNFHNTEYFPIESIFQPYRPGESLTHPYLPDEDRYIRKSRAALKVQKPVSLIFNALEYIDQTLKPYKQIRNSIFNTYRYYISAGRDDGSYTTVQAKYHQFLDVNKIVIKNAIGGVSASGHVGSLDNVHGTLILLGPGGSTLETIAINSGAFDDSGMLTLYYDGISWTSTRGSWAPPQLTDSGVLDFVTSSVTGLIYQVTTPKQLTPSGRDRSHIIEISPRLEIDFSEITKSVSTSKTIDDSDSVVGFPFGFINSNKGSISLHNIPVYKNGFPHTIFDNISSNATFSDLMREGTKFTVGLISPSLDFTEYVPFFTMFVDSWTVQDLDTVTVDVFDASKSYLQSMEAPPYLSWSESVFDTIVNILEVSGFSDYDYDGLKEILDRKQKTVSSFWCDRNKTVFDVLKEFFVANQIGAAFDEYGVLRFFDLDYYIYQYTSSTFTPDFIVSDIPSLLIKSDQSIINYESNLIKDTYAVSVEKKIGKVTIDYKIPSRNTSADATNAEGFSGKATLSPQQVFTQTDNLKLIKSWTNQSVFAKDRIMIVDPHLLTGKKVENSIVSSGDYSGIGFMQGELVSWDSMEWSFDFTIPADTYLFTNLLSASVITNYLNTASGITPITAIKFVTDNHNIVTGQKVKFSGLPSTKGLDRLNYVSACNNYYSVDSVSDNKNFMIAVTDSMFTSPSFVSGNVTSLTASATVDEVIVHSTSKMVKSSSELTAHRDDIFASNPMVKSVIYQPTGRIGGLTRGLRNTSVIDHVLYDDTKVTVSGKKKGWVTSDKGFHKYYLDAAGVHTFSSSSSATSITFENNTCHFSVNKNTNGTPIALALSPMMYSDKLYAQVPTNANLFDHFSAVFQVPSSKKGTFVEDTTTKELGIFIRMAGNKTLMIGIRDNHHDTKHKSCRIAFGRYSDYCTVEVINDTTKSQMVLDQITDVFDGKKHRLAITTDWKHTIWLYLDEKLISKYVLAQTLSKSTATQWGFYVENMVKKNPSDKNHSIKVDLHELYALDINSPPYRFNMNLGQSNLFRHHWVNPHYLDALMRRDKNAEPKYYFWGDNILTGAYIYDAKEFSTSPVMETSLKISSDFGYLPETQAGGSNPKRASISDVSTSQIFASPFNFSMMVVNNEKHGGTVTLGSSNNQVAGGALSPFTIMGQNIKLSDSHTFSKTINHSESSQSITLTTLWIQNTREAEELIRQVELMADAFSSHIDVTIFGNPLIQVGDICQFTYSLKKIGYDPEKSNADKVYCIVKSVNQDFSGGLKTDLSLRPMFKIKSTPLE